MVFHLNSETPILFCQGCPERVWCLHSQRYSKPYWTWPLATFSSWPCCQDWGIELYDIKKQLSAKTILWIHKIQFETLQLCYPDFTHTTMSLVSHKSEQLLETYVDIMLGKLWLLPISLSSYLQVVLLHSWEIRKR